MAQKVGSTLGSPDRGGNTGKPSFILGRARICKASGSHRLGVTVLEGSGV